MPNTSVFSFLTSQHLPPSLTQPPPDPYAPTTATSTNSLLPKLCPVFQSPPPSRLTSGLYPSHYPHKSLTLPHPPPTFSTTPPLPCSLNFAQYSSRLLSHASPPASVPHTPPPSIRHTQRTSFVSLLFATRASGHGCLGTSSFTILL